MLALGALHCKQFLVAELGKIQWHWGRRANGRREVSEWWLHHKRR